MKKFFKWLGIVAGSLVVLLIVVALVGNIRANSLLT